MSVNKVILVGHLGNDPEIRQFDNGMIATVSIATNERWTDKQTGDKREHTEWHRVVFNGRLAEIARDYLKKGALIYVEGSLRTRKWTDKSDGIERYSTEIRADGLKMLSGRTDQPNQAQQQQAPQSYQQPVQQGYTQPPPVQSYQQPAQQAPQGYQQAPQQQQGQRYATHPNGAPVFPPQPIQQPAPQGYVTQPAQAVADDDIPF